ncbi:polyprenyl synthetase family protein [Syntrophomonas erecta]
MEEVLRTHNQEVDSIIEYLMQTRGKMLRPRLVYLCASLYPADPARVKDGAVAVELIHLASLVHDDVIDNSASRRGKPSLNGRCGNKASVLAGDYLFATAFNLINNHSPKVMDCITETIQIMCCGEIQQLSLGFKLDTSLEEYYEKIFRKTACLFATSCKVGGLVSAMPVEEITLLEQYGLCLGYAYQILDDLLDYVGDPQLMGKPVGNDLSQGNITLPLILLMQNPKHRILVEGWGKEGRFAKNNIRRVVNLIHNSGVITESLEVVHSFIVSGLELLKGLPEVPARHILANMGEGIIDIYYRQTGENRRREFGTPS